jgi:2C-methyl-D-erythritol 2,4-cyclodiphosphate synthase
LHSIADSILGASALGDIGIFFSRYWQTK